MLLFVKYYKKINSGEIQMDRISYESLYMGSLITFTIAIKHFLIAIDQNIQIDNFTAVAFWWILLFSVVEQRMVYIIWRNRNNERLSALNFRELNIVTYRFWSRYYSAMMLVTFGTYFNYYTA